MELKKHLKKGQLSYLNLVLLDAKETNAFKKRGNQILYNSQKIMFRKKYNNKKTQVGFQYFKPISKIIKF
jgi:hypothetical protein